MSGSVALTIREPDGKEHRMCRSTCLLSPYINNKRLFEKDPSFTPEILKMWYAWREDFEANKSTGRFKLEETEIYAPHPFLAPNNYGLVIVDMVNNQILDYQSYGDIGYLQANAIRNYVRLNMGLGRGANHSEQEGLLPKQVCISAFESQDESSIVMRFRRLFESKRITEAFIRDQELKVPLVGKTLEDVAKLIETERFAEFPIDTSPFKVTVYREHDPEEAKRMLTQISELGFELSDREKKIWDEWIREKSRSA